MTEGVEKQWSIHTMECTSSIKSNTNSNTVAMNMKSEQKQTDCKTVGKTSA